MSWKGLNWFMVSEYLWFLVSRQTPSLFLRYCTKPVKSCTVWSLSRPAVQSIIVLISQPVKGLTPIWPHRMALLSLQELSPGPEATGAWDYHHRHHLYLSATLCSREAWDGINQVTSKFRPHFSRLMEAWVPTPHCWRECLEQVILGSGVGGGYPKKWKVAKYQTKI